MTNAKTILITGATGTIGRPLARSLAKARGVRLCALVRNPASAADLADAGVALVPGSFEDPASLAAAMSGVDTLVLITAANSRAAEQAAAAIEAARGVRRIIRLSAVKASVDGPTDNTRQHGRTEAALRATGAATTILRPMAFFQNLLWSVDAVALQGTLSQAIGDARLSLIDTRDVVEALERVTLFDRHDGKTFELTGPAAIGYAQVAESLGRALGRSVRYMPITPDALAEFARRGGVDDWTAALMHDYSVAYGNGYGDFTTDAVETLTGHPARSVDDFAREVFTPAARAAA